MKKTKAATVRILSDEAIQDDNLTLRIPEHVLEPGGLISKCMAEMRSSGLPDIPQYNFPVVLAAIARAYFRQDHSSGVLAESVHAQGRPDLKRQVIF